MKMMLRPFDISPGFFPSILDPAISFDDLHYPEKGVFGNGMGDDRLSDKSLLLPIAMMKGGDQGEGDLTIVEIDPDLLSKFLFVGSVIEMIINELKGDADIHPKLG
jgi:hypothetical protein